MSDDKIEEIRARHQEVPSGNFSIAAISLAHADRATLLDEVDRQRAEIEKLRASIQSLAESLRASLDAAIRLRDEARAENEKLRAENEALHEALRRGDGDRFVVERRTTGPDTPVAFIREGKP